MKYPETRSQPIWRPTEEEEQGVYRYVMDAGVARAQTMPDFNSADFLAGAMAVYYALGWQLMLPGNWVFGLLAGRDPIEDYAKGGQAPDTGKDAT